VIDRVSKIIHDMFINFIWRVEYGENV